MPEKISDLSSIRNTLDANGVKYSVVRDGDCFALTVKGAKLRISGPGLPREKGQYSKAIFDLNGIFLRHEP